MKDSSIIMDFQFRFANKTDCILSFLGILCAIFSGICFPILSIISGRITNILLTYSATSDVFREKGYENVYLFLGIGTFSLLVSFFQYFCFQTACNRIIVRIKCNYVASIVRQNAGWFDKNHSGTLTTRLNE